MNNLDECFHDIMYGWIQVFIAAIHYEHHPYALLFLSKYGGRIYEYCGKKQSALFPAIEDNNLLMLRYLHCNSTQINYEDKNGFTPLMYASLHNRLEIVKYLIDNNASVNAKTSRNFIDRSKFYLDSGSTALIISSIVGNTEIVVNLLERDALSNISIDGFGDGEYSQILFRYENSAFISAAKHNHIDILDLLIKYNVDDGFTALMWASKNNNMNMVNLLLKYNATINLQNMAGYSALYYAQENSNTDLINLIASSIKTE